VLENHLVELNITPFKFKHFNDLIALLESNNYPDVGNITYKTLPKVGNITYLGKQPVACGFLRRLEPCFAQIDTLTSSRFFGSEIRHLGIDMVVNALLEDAKRLKLHGIVAHTSDEGILKRAQSIGFHIVQQTIIAKPL
jgi:hypothetical protein